MNGIFFSVIVFFINSLVHIVFHKLLKAFGVKTFYSLLIYLVGIWVLLNLQPLLSGLILTSILLYILLVGVYSLYYTVAVKQYDSPTSRLLTLVRDKGKLTEKELLRQFTFEDLVLSRVRDFEKSHVLYERNNRLFTAGPGRLLYTLMQIYRLIEHIR